MSTLPLFLVNYSTDPQALRQYDVYLAASSLSSDGKHYQYSSDNDENGGAIHAFSRASDYRDLYLYEYSAVSYARYTLQGTDTVWIENQKELVTAVLPDGSHFIASENTFGGEPINMPVRFSTKTTSITLLEIGVYKRQTWNVLYQAYKAGYLPTPWFDSTNAPSRLLPD